ncbi:putative membrane protein [Geobacillus kaustophilus]|uniref:Putative membrane protein n=1 Tax=Geobacillus kaustophilus TaxID=1462 RepID=A0A0D8BWC1_GEOKU|nr:putative membrane protein [Geobacillus kaustophilus]
MKRFSRIILISSLVGVIAFVTVILLYEIKFFKTFSINIPKWLFVIITGLIYIKFEEKWWIKLLSFILGIVIFMVLLVIFIP